MWFSRVRVRVRVRVWVRVRVRVRVRVLHHSADTTCVSVSLSYGGLKAL